MDEETRKNAERYLKLKQHATEKLLNPKHFNCEIMPDGRTHWVLPLLMCSGPVGGFVSFDEAVDKLV